MKIFLNVLLSTFLISLLSQSAIAQEWPVNSVATSSAIWPNASLRDGNVGTVWSSNGYTESDHTEWLAYWFDSFHPVNYVKLYPRFVNGVSLGFPGNVDVYWSDGSKWNLAKSYASLPTPQKVDYVVLSLPVTVNANAIRVVANKLGSDEANNYYFQVAEVGAGLGIDKSAVDYSSNSLPGNPVIKIENNEPKSVTIGDLEVALYDFAYPGDNNNFPGDAPFPAQLQNYGAAKRECLKINPDGTSCFSTFPFGTTLSSVDANGAICGYATLPAIIVSCKSDQCISEVFNQPCETRFPSLSSDKRYNTSKANGNIGSYIADSDELSSQGFNTKYDLTGNLNTAALILSQGRIPIIGVGSMLFDPTGNIKPNAEDILNEAITNYPQVFASGAVIELSDEPFNEPDSVGLTNKIKGVQQAICMLRAKIPTAQLGINVAPVFDGTTVHIFASMDQVIGNFSCATVFNTSDSIYPAIQNITGNLQWLATDLYTDSLNLDATPHVYPQVTMANQFLAYMNQDAKHQKLGKWLIVQGFAPINSASPQTWNDEPGTPSKNEFKNFMTSMAAVAANYSGVMVWGWNSVSQLNDAFAGKNFPDDVKHIYQEPTCTSAAISLAPSSVPSSGGVVSAQANCSDGVLSYAWTVNGAAYAGNLATNSLSIAPNTTASLQTYTVCVTATNVGGQSAPVCTSLVEAGIGGSAAPVCESVSLAPSSLSAGGGMVSALANCSGSGLTYTWTVNGTTYPGNLSTNSSPVSPNTTTSDKTYTICVTASNASGQSSAVCTPLIEAATVAIPAPVCESVNLAPSSLSASGGTVSALANCSGSGLTYAWTVNGSAYPGNLSSNSSQVSPNTTTSPKTYMVCVAASNVSGQSPAVCAPVVQAGTTAATAPVCSSVSLTPSNMPASGGFISAQANCSGTVLTYAWTVNGATYPGTLSTNSSSISPNTTASPIIYMVCVTASNASGQSPAVCSQVVEAATPVSTSTTPVCSSVSLSPSNVAATGGTVSAQANCTGSGLNYVWTVNGNAYPGNLATNSTSVTPNTTASPIIYTVCVTASNSSGQSPAVCTQGVEAATAVSTPTIPTCLSVNVTPGTLPATGGTVSAQANCTGTGLTYIWTANGNTYPGNLAANSTSVSPNTTASPITYMVCVVARNTAGQSAAVCTPVEEAGVTAPTPTAPVCSSVNVTPSNLPATGGTVSAQANCTGNGLTYTWTVNGNTYPGNLSTNSTSVSPNTTASSVNYTVCVTASNTVGQSPAICTAVVEAASTVSATTPVCSSVGLNPSSLPAAGGTISAQANCTGTGLSYAWTVNGNAYPGNLATNSSPVSPNTTASPITYTVCVTASNAGGQSSSVCTQAVQAATAILTAPPCSSVSLNPVSLPAAGGTISAQANCTGTGLSYAWTVNGNAYPGNLATNSSPVSPNTTASPITYTVCVTASNAGGQSSPVCTQAVQAAAATPAAPVCSSVGLNPISLSAAGGTVSAQANCTGTGLTYVWTVNGNTYPGNLATNSTSVTPNTTASPINYTVCVTASNAGGQSAQVCTQGVQAATATPVAPVCSSVGLNPTSLSAAGGTVSAQANCTGTGLTYVWTVNGNTYPGNLATNSTSVTPNTTASSINYTVCVTASNAGGQSAQVCTQGVQTATPVAAPVCAAMNVTPSNLPASGGTVSAQATCSGTGLTYVWTVNGNTYPGNLSSNSTSVSPNTTASGILYTVCATASNAGGQSQVCGQLVEAGVAPLAAPVCSAVTLAPNSLPANGGTVSAQANCTGSGLTYAWTVNSAAYPGNLSTNSSPVGANTTNSAAFYTVCVTATNASGQSSNCGSLVEAAAIAIAPVCTSLTLSSYSFPSTGGNVSAQANCTNSGQGLYYTWSVNGQPFPGPGPQSVTSQPTLSSPLGVNASASPASYTLCVVANDSNGQSQQVCAATLTEAGATSVPPSAPTISTATAGGNGTLNVYFTPGAQGTGTLLYYTANCGTNPVTGSGSPITVSGLSTGEPYLCKVETTTTAGTSAWSDYTDPVFP